MTRLVIYASYDTQGIVHDYVISYLKRLKRVADKIIFIADNKAKVEEKQKLNGLVEFCDFAPHGEYDFGSYKRGYQYAAKQGLLEEADELILCNDSCFSVMDFDQMFSEMSQRDCDFWGVTDSLEIQHHLQSYFLVFKKNVFLSSKFQNFLSSITKKNNFCDIVKCYEIPIKSYFEEDGYKSSSYIISSNKCNPTIFPINLLNNKSPLIKKKCFIQKNHNKDGVLKLLLYIKKHYHPCYKDIRNYFSYNFSYYYINFIYNIYFNLQLFPSSFIRKLKRWFYKNKNLWNTCLLGGVDWKNLYRQQNKHNFTVLKKQTDISRIIVGNYSYGDIDVEIAGVGNSKLIIGNYVSIGPNVHFILQSEHFYKGLSTYPFKVMLGLEASEAISKGNIIVEDDVWIGLGSIIGSGVHIGKGAIIGCGSVVVKDVEPYSIVGGNPAKLIKYRFEESIRQKLQNLQLSKLNKEKAIKNIDLLYQQVTQDNIDNLLDEVTHE